MSRHIQNKTKGRGHIIIKKCVNCYETYLPRHLIKTKFCGRKCYLEYIHKKAKKVFKKHLFKCSVCGKKRIVLYREWWGIKKRKASKCFKCSRLKKGQRNNGSFKKGIVPWNKGKGKASYWQRIKTSKKWRDWRNEVFIRDGYTCQKCRKMGGELHPHHIKAKTLFPEVMFEVSNGITLCKKCHRKTDTYGYRVKRLKILT